MKEMSGIENLKAKMRGVKLTIRQDFDACCEWNKLLIWIEEYKQEIEPICNCSNQQPDPLAFGICENCGGDIVK